MNFETIIGIEIHLQLKTKTKMFSPAQNVSNAAPNTHVHPIDMGFPGVLPRVNKKAVELALMKLIHYYALIVRIIFMRIYQRVIKLHKIKDRLGKMVIF